MSLTEEDKRWIAHTIGESIGASESRLVARIAETEGLIGTMESRLVAHIAETEALVGATERRLASTSPKPHGPSKTVPPR